MRPSLTEFLALAAGSALILGGISKIAVPTALSSTLREMGVSVAAKVGIVRLFGLLELILAFGLLVWRHWMAGLGILILAGCFAGAGIVAIRRATEVECSCLGIGRSRLGFTQLVSLPIWTLVAILTLSDAYTGAAQHERLMTASLALAISASVRVLPAVKLMGTVRKTRYALGMPR